MPEYIEREAFIEDIKTEIMNLYLDGLKGTPRPRDELYGFIERINAQPAADVVPVVRCTRCQHSREFRKRDPYEAKYGEGYLWCTEHGDGVKRDDYCSHGTQKEEAK